MFNVFYEPYEKLISDKSSSSELHAVGNIACSGSTVQVTYSLGGPNF